MGRGRSISGAGSYDVPPPGRQKALKDTGARVWPYYLHGAAAWCCAARPGLVATCGNSRGRSSLALDGLTPEQILEAGTPTPAFRSFTSSSSS